MFDFLNAISNTVGIIGVVLILIAYYLVSLGRMNAMSLAFQWLNFWGAWFILYSLFFHWNLASVVIEVAWIIISVMGIVRIIKDNRKKSCLI